jgi:hypothetical protein
MRYAIASLICAAAVVSASSSAQAQLIGYEGFNGYAAGELGGQVGVGSVGFSETSWATGSNKTVDLLGLDYADGNGNQLVTSGGSIRSQGDWNRAHRGLTTAFPTSVPGGGKIWASYLFRANGNNDGGPFQVRFYGQGGWDGGNKVSFDVVSNGPAFQHQAQPFVWFGNGNEGGAFRPNITGVNLIVAEYTLDDSGAAGNQGSINLYVNPIIGGAVPVDVPVSSMTNIGGLDPLDRLSIAGNNAGPWEGSWDEIRWGTSFASVTPVIPEPTTIAVMGAGAMLVLRRRAR